MEWRCIDSWGEVRYDIISVLSIGIVPVISVFYPSFGVRLKTISCNPSESTIVISQFLTEDGEKEFVSNVKHLLLNSTEHVVAFESNCQRYCASSCDKFDIYQVKDVPVNMKRFLVAYNEVSRDERDLIALLYGPNSMDIPPTDLFAITVRHALNPLILFGYFSFVIWTLESYYWWSGFLLFMVFGTIYIMVEATCYNLKRLRELAGQHQLIQRIDIDTYRSVDCGLQFEKRKNREDVIDEETKVNTFTADDGRESRNGNVDLSSSNLYKLVNVDDSELVVGDRFVITEGMTLPCDTVLISGRVVMDESMLTGKCRLYDDKL